MPFHSQKSDPLQDLMRSMILTFKAVRIFVAEMEPLPN